MSETQERNLGHTSAVIATLDLENEMISYQTAAVEVLDGEYFVADRSGMMRPSEIDNGSSRRAVRLLWRGETVTGEHKNTLASKLRDRFDLD